VENYVDILFANEEEALAYTGEEPRKAIEILSQYCRIAVVKCGAQGSFVGCEGIITEVPATPEVRVDSTGAGDLYASGFLSKLLVGSLRCYRFFIGGSCD
jgi:sugar/nucleoside kinase (ribokinase family)